MKKLFIVGNWKCNKTIREAETWFKKVASSQYLVSSNIEIIICPPFTLLPLLSSKFSVLGSKFQLGAQNVSPFPDGAYTGEISARMLMDLGVKYVLVGHSERRKYFKEDDQTLANKVNEALDNSLMPIFCVQGKTSFVPQGIKIILYEPLSAIGTGLVGSAKEANEVAQVLREISGPETIILYGGSVKPENVAEFCREDNISGVAVGGASLDPSTFLEIAQNASEI